MSKAQWIKENLNAGEHYAGIVLGQNGEDDYHLIVLPGDMERANWKGAQDFAKKAGGELPNRREQRVLFANAQQHFKSAYYWSGEQHTADSDSAWMQNFSSGNQYHYHEDSELRARAVRRIYITG